MADPLSIASGIAGLVAIADTIFGRVYSYARAVKGAAKEIEELACEIRNLSGILHGLELVLNELLKDSAEPNLRLHHINSCRATLFKIRNKLDSPDITASQRPSLPTTARFVPTVQKLKWPFSRSETSELLAEVERHKATINIALSGDNLATVVRALSRQEKIAHDIEAIKDYERDRSALEKRVALTGKRKEVLGLFEKVDSSASHYANLKLRHPLTGLWLTEGTTFKTWLHTRGSKLWLSGIPGAGKTVLAACAIEEAIAESSATQAVAYFYCDYKEAATADPINILGSLAAQIGKHDEAAFLYLQELYERCRRENGTPLPVEIPDLEKSFQHMASCFEDVSIVIDGLDECGDRTSKVVSTLTNLASAGSSNIRTLLLSRNEHIIQQLLCEEYNHLEIAAHTEDLELYVAAELESRQRKHGRERLRIRNHAVKEDLKNILVERADGMFRWVACQLDFLCGLPNDTAMRQALNSLPPTLFETYEKLLERVNTRHGSVKLLVQRTLRWIVHGQESLSIDALCQAISFQDGDKTLHEESLCEEEDILVHCSSLIRRTADGKCLELAHFTVKEFLLSLSTDFNSPLAPYSQVKDHVLPYLAQTCLTYLTFEDFQSRVIEDWAKWEEQQLQYPFRSHAVKFWDKYVEDAGAWEDEVVIEGMRSLFSSSKKSCFRSWIRDFVFAHVCIYWEINLSDSDFRIRSTEFDKANFEASTRCMCKGGVTPLHIAAALGSWQLAEWLLDSGSNKSHMSVLGTPIHCALAGFRNLGKPLGRLWQGDRDATCARRGKTIEFLIQENLDLPVSYRNHLGDECSWSVLAIISGIGCGRQHILVTLVAAGAKLDKGGLAGLEAWDFVEDAIGFDGESLEALLAKVRETNQDAEAWSDLLHAAIPLDIPMPTDLSRRGIARTADLSIEELDELFYDAIRFDNVGAIELLLGDDRLNSRVIQQRKHGKPAIHLAVSSNSLDALEMLLSSGLDVNKTDGFGKTALHLAAEDEFASRVCISTLLDHGASTTVVDKRGYSVWHAAASSNNKTAIQILLDRDDDKHKAQLLRNEDGFVPLFVAAYRATKLRADAFKSLLLHYGDLDNLPQTSPEGLRLVHYAVGMDSLELLQLLQAKGFDLRQQTDDGRSAFHFISLDADPDVLELLIANGVDPSAPAHDGATPLHTFMKRVVATDDRILNILATNESVNATTEDGQTPLHLMITSAVCSEYMYRLRRHILQNLVVCKSANIHALDKAGRSCIWMVFKAWEIGKPFNAHDTIERQTFVELVASIIELTTEPAVLQQQIPWEGNTCSLLNWAICLHYDSLIVLLLSKGFDVDLKMGFPGGNIIRSAVETACLYGCNPDGLSILIERSKRLLEPDEGGHYLSHLTCASHHDHNTFVLEKLCEYGFDWDQRAVISSRTPIMHAAMVGKPDHVKFLLRHNVDLRAKDSHNWQLSHWAASCPKPESLKELIGRDVDWNAEVHMRSKGEHLAFCSVLHIAAASGNPENIRLIVHGSLIKDIDVLNGHGMSPLHIAAGHGSAEMVEILIQAGANIDLKSPWTDNSMRPIHMAISHGIRATTQALLRLGCSLAHDSQGVSLELWALKYRQNEIISILKEYIVEKEQTDHLKRGVSNSAKPRALAKLQDLNFAIDAGDRELCRALIESENSPSRYLSRCTGCSPVHRALQKKRDDIASYFVNKGVPVGGQLCSNSAIQGSAIHLAIHQHSEDTLLNLLLIKDHQMGHPSFRSAVSPIHIAVGSQHHTALRILLQYGQKQNWLAPRKGKDGGSTSSDAYLTSKHTLKDANFPWEGASALCDVSFDSDTLEWQWQLSSWQPNTPKPLTTEQIGSGSPLHIAAFLDDLESAKILLEFGALADLPSSCGDTPMHIAARSGSLEIVRLLVQYGANPNTLNHWGETGAMIAAEEGHAIIVKYFTGLAHYSMDPNHCDLLDMSILHEALYTPSRSSAETVSHLLLSGCSPYIKDSYNKTPFEKGLWWNKGQNGVSSLMLNWDMDLELCARILPELSLSRISDSAMKRLLRRLSGTRVSQEIDKISPYGRRGTLLAQAAIIDSPKLLEILIRAGATLDHGESPGGTALLVACTGGRFSAVKYLIRAGANVFGARNGATISVVQAAQAFPDIVQWLLVERYIDQRKLCWNSCGGTEQSLSTWSGPVTVEVPILGLYSPMHGASSFEKAVDLFKLRGRLLGCIVHY